MLRRRTLGNIVSENLHNPDTDIEDVYLDNGIEASYTGWSATDWIPVTPGKYLITSNYSYPSTAGPYNMLYDADKKMTKFFLFGMYKGITETVLNVTSECHYVRFSDETQKLKTMEIYRLDG